MAHSSIRRGDRRILFPWEARGGLRRFVELGRIRPIAIVVTLIAILLSIAVREHRAAGIRRRPVPRAARCLVRHTRCNMERS